MKTRASILRQSPGKYETAELDLEGPRPAIRKGGTTVVTGVGSMTEVGIPVPPFELTLMQKRLQGSLFGACSPSIDILRQLELYRSGLLKLDELITSTYTLDEVAKGYEDMHAGKNIRGVIVFD